MSPSVMLLPLETSPDSAVPTHGCWGAATHAWELQGLPRGEQTFAACCVREKVGRLECEGSYIARSLAMLYTLLCILLTSPSIRIHLA